MPSPRNHSGSPLCKLPDNSNVIVKPIVLSQPTPDSINKTLESSTSTPKTFHDHWKDGDPKKPVHGYKPYNCRRKPRKAKATDTTMPSAQTHRVNVDNFWETFLGPKPAGCNHPMAG